MEYWIVYDIATGEDRWRGSGPTGSAAAQQLGEGLAIAVVPQRVIAGAQLDLAALREVVMARIDGEAGLVRLRFLSDGPGQEATYLRKEIKARAYVAGDESAAMFLTPEADARGMTVADLAAEVIARADQWEPIGAAIEGLRMGAKTRAAAAVTLGAIIAAARIDWSAFGGE